MSTSSLRALLLIVELELEEFECACMWEKVEHAT
jgi:hypothetical protein